MKLLLTLTVLLSSQLTFAQNFSPLTSGDLGLSAAKVDMLDVSQMCPRVPGQMSCMAFGSYVKVKVTLNGCKDRFGGFFSSFEEVNGKGVLSVAAININNKASLTTYCNRAPTKTVSVYVGYEGRIDLKEMSYSAVQQ
ncbi:MAG TPA: hypothetical protein VNJ01_14880 [Bacteriovoracaceae bacterium]|nr:hypothetical protein [Bacteriovoracaceae bacterium]